MKRVDGYYSAWIELNTCMLGIVFTANVAQMLTFQDDLSGISFVIYTLPSKRFPHE